MSKIEEALAELVRCEEFVEMLGGGRPTFDPYELQMRRTCFKKVKDILEREENTG